MEFPYYSEWIAPVHFMSQTSLVLSVGELSNSENSNSKLNQPFGFTLTMKLLQLS